MLTVDGRKVSARELVKKYNIPLPKYGDTVIIRLKRDLVKWDELNKEYRYPASIREYAAYTVIDKETGEPMEIRYMDTPPRQRSRNGITENIYNPHKMVMTGDRMIFDVTVELEKYVWWYLHPKNESSPFHTKEHEAKYELYDPDAEAVKEVSQVEHFIEGMETFQQLRRQGKWDEIRIRAKGIGIQKVDTMGNETLSKYLIDKCRNNPITFKREFDNIYTRIKGVIVDCIDKGILYTMTRNSNVYWYVGDTEVVKSDKNRIPKKFIVEYLLENWADWKDSVAKAIKEHNKRAKVENRAYYVEIEEETPAPASPEVEPAPVLNGDDKTKEDNGDILVVENPGDMGIEDIRRLVYKAIEADTLRLTEKGEFVMWFRGKAVPRMKYKIPKNQNPITSYVKYLSTHINALKKLIYLTEETLEAIS